MGPFKSNATSSKANIAGDVHASKNVTAILLSA